MKPIFKLACQAALSSVSLSAALLLAAVWPGCPASAQQPGGAAVLATADASAAAALARYKAATGGAAWDSVHTMDTHLDVMHGETSSGSEEWDDVVGGQTAFFSKNDNSRSIEGYDGKRDWAKYNNDPVIYNDGPAEQQDAVTSAYQRTNSFWYSDRLPGKVTYIGQVPYKKAFYDVVQCQPDGGVLFQMWINHATGLLDLQIQPTSTGTDTVFLSKYRPVEVPGAGSVLMPFQADYDDGKDQPAGKWSIKFIRVNTPPPAGVFDAPTDFKPDYSFRHPGETSTTVPFQYVNKQIRVPIKVNGVAETAWLDTGGAFILAQHTAGELQIPVSSGAEATGNGESTVQAGFTRPDSMEVGDMKMKQPTFEVVGSYDDLYVPAIIGAELLRRFVVSIDFDTHLLTLTEPSAFHYTGSGIVLPFHIHDEHMPIVDGTVDGLPGTFIIDTGDAVGMSLYGQFIIANDLKDKYQPKFSTAAGYGIGGPNYAYVARAKTVTLGGATINNPVIFLRGGKTGASADRYVSGAIAMPELHQFNLIFDYADEKMIMEPNKSYGDADGFGRTGIMTDPFKLGKVSQIIPDSPAEKAGLQMGDVIQSIDGVKLEVKQEALEKLDNYNFGPVGSSVVIVYKDTHGQTKTVTLVLKDLV